MSVLEVRRVAGLVDVSRSLPGRRRDPPVTEVDVQVAHKVWGPA